MMVSSVATIGAHITPTDMTAASVIDHDLPTSSSMKYGPENAANRVEIREEQLIANERSDSSVKDVIEPLDCTPPRDWPRAPAHEARPGLNGLIARSTSLWLD